METTQVVSKKTGLCFEENSAQTIPASTMQGLAYIYTL
jgi:hypothetical protein